MGPPVYSLASLPSLLIAPQNSASCLLLLLFLLSYLVLPRPVSLGDRCLSELLGRINNLTSSYSRDYVIQCRCVFLCVCGGTGWGNASAACPYVGVLAKWLLWPRYQEAYEYDAGRRGGGFVHAHTLRAHTLPAHTHTNGAIRLICVTLNNLKLHLDSSCCLAHIPLSFMAARVPWWRFFLLLCPHT